MSPQTLDFLFPPKNEPIYFEADFKTTAPSREFKRWKNFTSVNQEKTNLTVIKQAAFQLIYSI